jgi:hypothetical protein
MIGAPPVYDGALHDSVVAPVVPTRVTRRFVGASAATVDRVVTCEYVPVKPLKPIAATRNQ